MLTFRTKVDLWLLIVLLTVVAASLLGLSHAYVAWSAQAALAQKLPLIALIAVCVVGAAVPLWLLLTTRYRLSDERLDAHSGPFHWSVPVSEIVDVSSPRGASLGPALSLDRIRIEYGGGRSLAISPENKQAFLRQLEARRQQARQAD
jgi:membrane protein YdbS with pleckstrin-like domain